MARSNGIARAHRMLVKRKLIVAAAVLLLVVLGGFFWLRANLDGVVQRAIVHYGGQMTQAPVAVAKVRIDSADGAGAIHGLQLGNPRGMRSRSTRSPSWSTCGRCWTMSSSSAASTSTTRT
jgi:hypothetical protein